jgi:aspartate carbamoyltransferase catalytic subunit
MKKLRKLPGVIRAQQFDRATLERIFSIASEMERLDMIGYRDVLRGKLMATLFYEPSTRTRLSFEAAMKKLGGEVIGTENAHEFSSAAKGESLEDSVRVISGYADLVVLRYDKEGGAERAEKFSNVPVINAGDGTGQHPTQALLDLYTIQKKFKDISRLKIALVGDLANGRTVRSLCYFLAKHYPNNEIFFASPEQVRMRDDIKEYMNKYGVQWQEVSSLKDILPQLDVIYQTRVQKERFKDKPEMHEKVVRESERFIIDKDCLDLLKKEAIIMHPLPRLSEISYAVDSDPRATYFQQAKNGLYVRMALIKMILAGY